MFTAEQHESVRLAFDASGFVGALRTLPLDSGHEVCFVLTQDDLLKLPDVVELEQKLERALGCKVWLLSSVGDRTDSFD